MSHIHGCTEQCSDDFRHASLFFELHACTDENIDVLMVAAMQIVVQRINSDIHPCTTTCTLASCTVGAGFTPARRPIGRCPQKCPITEGRPNSVRPRRHQAPTARKPS